MSSIEVWGGMCFDCGQPVPCECPPATAKLESTDPEKVVAARDRLWLLVLSDAGLHISTDHPSPEVVASALDALERRAYERGRREGIEESLEATKNIDKKTGVAYWDLDIRDRIYSLFRENTDEVGDE